MNFSNNYHISYITTPNIEHLVSIPSKQISIEEIDKRKAISGSYILFLDTQYAYEHFNILDYFFREQESILGFILLDIENRLLPLFSEFIKHFNRKDILEKIIAINDNKVAEEIIERIAHAHKIKSSAELIMHAEILSDKEMRIISCDFKKIDINISNIKCLQNLTLNELKNFTVDKHGSYLYWKDKDIHLDLTSFRAAADPVFKENLFKKSIRINKKLGQLMKKFRESKEVKQSDFEGISERQLRRYENGEQLPTYKTFEKISKKFDLSVQEYLKEIESIDKR